MFCAAKHKPTVRRYASVVYAVVAYPSVRPSVRPSVCLSQAGILSKRLGKSSWFWHDMIRYDTRCYFNVRSKADMSQLNLPHGTDNEKV